MKLIITRFRDIHDGTLGRFTLMDGKKELLKGFSLEPAGKDEVRRGLDRRVPVGVYDVAWHNSPKFKRLLPLLHNENVPKNRYILIHHGNFPKDTEGCILLGGSFDNKGVYNSKDMLDKFLGLTINQKLTVEIKNGILKGE